MYTKILSVITFLFLSFFLKAAERETSKLNDFVESYVNNGEFNGTVLISIQNKILLKKGYGYANAEWSIPNTVNTKFRIASTTKPFTAALILKLVEQDKIDLNLFITDYLPDYRSDTGSKVTIAQLLNHTSGIPNIFSHPDFKKIEANNPYDLDEYIAKFCSGDLKFEPGSQFSYSNAGYSILGKIIEKVTGLNYAEAMQVYIFEPLNMQNSGDSYSSSIIPQIATGYSKTLSGLKRAQNIDMTVTYAAGSIYSTVEDLYQFINAFYANKVFNEAIRKKALSPSSHHNYGYGWLVTTLSEDKFGKTLTQIHHPGMMPGFNGDLIHIIEDDITIVIQNNTGGAPLRAMTEGILNIIYNRPASLPQPPLEQKIYSRLQVGGIKAAIKFYQELEARNESFSERQLNYFGYKLMEVKQFDAAVEFFKLNAKKFPESSNAFDSLGEAYLANKNLEEALISYKKSLLINEKNTNAINAIAKIKKLL